MSAATEIRGALTDKVGPLPTWVYGVGLGVGVLGVLAWRDRRNKAATAPPAAGADDKPATAGSATPTFDYEASDFTLSPSPMGGGTWAVAPRSSDAESSFDDDSSSDTGIATNPQWVKIAGDWLISVGYPPLDVSNALGRWMNGESLSASEAAIVNAGLRQFGQPPDGAPTVLVSPASARTATTEYQVTFYYDVHDVKAGTTTRSSPQATGWFPTVESAHASAEQAYDQIVNNPNYRGVFTFSGLTKEVQTRTGPT